MLWYYNLFGPNVCPIRLAGDLCLALSGPWLLYRIKAKGTAGVSLETQALRLLVFSSRYLDVFAGQKISIYNTLIKYIVLLSGLFLVIAVARGSGPKTLPGRIRCLMLALFFGVSIPLSLPLNYVPLSFYVSYLVIFLEIAWSFSMFLAIFADIPQFYLTATSGILDWQMVLYLVMITAYRLFYLPHWAIIYVVEHRCDIISVISGVCTVLVHFIAYLFIAWKKAAQAPEMQLEAHLEDGNPKKVEILFDEESEAST